MHKFDCCRGMASPSQKSRFSRGIPQLGRSGVSAGIRSDKQKACCGQAEKLAERVYAYGGRGLRHRMARLREWPCGVTPAVSEATDTATSASPSGSRSSAANAAAALAFIP